MRLESPEPKNESQFYQRVKDLTERLVFWERVEPRTESGFPDTYFVVRDGSGEGTVEFKYARTTTLPRISPTLRGNQKAALLEYFSAGGRRRFCLCYHKGYSYFYDTEKFVEAVLGRGGSLEWTSRMSVKDSGYNSWLVEILRRDGKI